MADVTRLPSARARSSASTSASVAAGGRSSRSSERMVAGTAASTSESRLSWPMAASMASTSASSGPMWRRAKRSSSRSARAGWSGTVEPRGGRAVGCGCSPLSPGGSSVASLVRSGRLRDSRECLPLRRPVDRQGGSPARGRRAAAPYRLTSAVMRMLVPLPSPSPSSSPAASPHAATTTTAPADTVDEPSRSDVEDSSERRIRAATTAAATTPTSDSATTPASASATPSALEFAQEFAGAGHPGALHRRRRRLRGAGRVLRGGRRRGARGDRRRLRRPRRGLHRVRRRLGEAGVDLSDPELVSATARPWTP